MREEQRGDAEDQADHHRGGAVEEGIAGQLRQSEADRGGEDAGHRRAVFEQDDEGRRVLRLTHRLEPAELALGVLEFA